MLNGNVVSNYSYLTNKINIITFPNLALINNNVLLLTSVKELKQVYFNFLNSFI